MTKYVSKSAQQTMAIAAGFARECKPGAVIAFVGGLGLGKTTFVKGLAEGLGITDPVTSPTFAIVNEYRCSGFNFYHFDMYKVSTWDDLYSVGFFDYADGNNILAVEWSENVTEALPDRTVYVRIKRGAGDSEREICIGGEEVLNENICP